MWWSTRHNFEILQDAEVRHAKKRVMPWTSLLKAYKYKGSKVKISLYAFKQILFFPISQAVGVFEKHHDLADIFEVLIICW